MRNRMRLAIPAITLLLTLPLACDTLHMRGTPTADDYRENGDGTVTDLKTKLIWQRCSVGQNNDAACSGEPKSMDWNTAIRTCKDLKLAGKTWRLPEKDELKSLVRCSDGTPTPLKDFGEGRPRSCGWSGGDSYEKTYQTPPIDTGAFPGTWGEYWSSSTDDAHAAAAWSVNFARGVASPAGPKDDYFIHVRCVTTGP